jgi:uncharacterized hydrophobic protein (TIGR00341 family)
MIVLHGDYNSLMIFRIAKTEVANIIDELEKIGVGLDFGIIDILPLNATIPDIIKEIPKKEIEKEIKNRLSLEEIKNNIEEIAALDINYYVFLLLAALIAGAGLLSGSVAIIIASMLLSPLMGPILGVSYGIVIKDKAIINNGLKGQIQGFILAISVGMIMGMFTRLIDPGFIFNDQILARNFPTILDVVVAICGGIAVGFCFSADIKSALVGIAIAISLLSPIVNTGIVLVFGKGLHALGSFTLVLTNIILINLCAVIIFKIKNIRSTPLIANDWKGPEEKIRKIQKEQETPVVIEPKSFIGKVKRRFKKEHE